MGLSREEIKAATAANDELCRKPEPKRKDWKSKPETAAAPKVVEAEAEAPAAPVEATPAPKKSAAKKPAAK